MKIEIEKEPDELYEEFKTYERCYFCGDQTMHWHAPTNTPVCPPCSENHSASEINKPWKSEQ